MQEFLAQSRPRDLGLLFYDYLVFHAQVLGEDLGDIIASQMQGRRHNVIRTLVRELQDVLAEIRFHRFEPMFLQALVEVDFLSRHGFRFDDQMRATLLGEPEYEVGHFLAVRAVHHLSTVRDNVLFKQLQIMIQMFDGVLLELIRLSSKFLIIGQQICANRTGTVRHQPIGGRVDGELKPRVAKGLIDGFRWLACHALISPPELPPDALCELATARDRSRLGSASGNWNRRRPPFRLPF